MKIPLCQRGQERDFSGNPHLGWQPLPRKIKIVACDKTASLCPSFLIQGAALFIFDVIQLDKENSQYYHKKWLY
jgi:hypothetical protein